MKGIGTCLWFDRQAEEAVQFYTSIFRDSKILRTVRYGEAAAKMSGLPPGSVLTMNFQIQRRDFVALNGGPMFKFTEAVSLIVNCENQEEVDEYWEKLLAGGEKSQCGWLKDKFGLSWQIVPTALADMLESKDPKQSERVMHALLQMEKLDIARLKQAYEGK